MPHPMPFLPSCCLWLTAAIGPWAVSDYRHHITCCPNKALSINYTRTHGKPGWWSLSQRKRMTRHFPVKRRAVQALTWMILMVLEGETQHGFHIWLWYWGPQKAQFHRPRNAFQLPQGYFQEFEQCLQLHAFLRRVSPSLLCSLLQVRGAKSSFSCTVIASVYLVLMPPISLGTKNVISPPLKTVSNVCEGVQNTERLKVQADFEICLLYLPTSSVL